MYLCDVIEKKNQKRRWFGEMVQSIKCLPHKYEDLSLCSQLPYKKLGDMLENVSMEAHKPISLVSVVKVQVNERSCLQPKVKCTLALTSKVIL